LRAQVYKALHGGVLPVAVKIVSTDSGLGGQDSFLQELETVKHLICPNIVQFLCAPPPCWHVRRYIAAAMAMVYPRMESFAID
jgi:hypothetical protein